MHYFLNPHPRIYLWIPEREEGKGIERQTDRHRLVASRTYPQTQTEPATQACAVTGIKPVTFQIAGHCSNQLSQGTHAFLIFNKMCACVHTLTVIFPEDSVGLQLIFCYFAVLYFVFLTTLWPSKATKPYLASNHSTRLQEN